MKHNKRDTKGRFCPLSLEEKVDRRVAIKMATLKEVVDRRNWLTWLDLGGNKD